MKKKHVFRENPNYAGRKPEILTPTCHDRSPCMDVECGSCGEFFHIHETQLARVPKHHGIQSACKNCGHVITFEPGYVEAGFAEMRRRGWIA
jgi:hypothetical protein